MGRFFSPLEKKALHLLCSKKWTPSACWMPTERRIALVSNNQS